MRVAMTCTLVIVVLARVAAADAPESRDADPDDRDHLVTLALFAGAGVLGALAIGETTSASAAQDRALQELPLASMNDYSRAAYVADRDERNAARRNAVITGVAALGLVAVGAWRWTHEPGRRRITTHWMARAMCDGVAIGAYLLATQQQIVVSHDEGTHPDEAGMLLEGLAAIVYLFPPIAFHVADHEYASALGSASLRLGMPVLSRAIGPSLSLEGRNEHGFPLASDSVLVGALAAMSIDLFLLGQLDERTDLTLSVTTRSDGGALSVSGRF